MAFEDANTIRTNIHVMCLDLEDAIGSTEYLLMSATMLRLGYSKHMVKTDHNLYTDNAVVVNARLGRTSLIPNTGRGTVL